VTTAECECFAPTSDGVVDVRRGGACQALCMPQAIWVLSSVFFAQLWAAYSSIETLDIGAHPSSISLPLPDLET